MHLRAVRVLVVALLLAAGIAAAFQFSFLVSQSRQLADDQRLILTRLARVEALAADLGAAQAGYVAPGQPDAPWVGQVSYLSPQLTATIAAVRTRARSAGAATAVQAMTDALSRFTAADTAAKDSLQQDQDLIAADVVFGEGREAITAVRDAARKLAAAEQSSYDTERAAVEQQLVLVPAAAAGIWLVGVLLLMPRTRAPKAAAPATLDLPATATPEPDRAAAAAPSPTVDLVEAADLCTALSRVVSSAALPDMLARAAALLDASGVIVWMGSGGELLAATSHGYDPRVISRLGAIPRDADNATAAAWRTGEIRTVPGDPMSNGAIVAPMFGPESCIGVLAAEVRHGREQDASTQAVTMMVAAQLATVLAAWPSAPPARAAEA